MQDEVSLTKHEDLRTQAAVMTLIVAEHPTLLTLCDVTMEMDDPDEAVERAVRDLVAVGLLRREGGSVLPTRAALTYDLLPL